MTHSMPTASHYHTQSHSFQAPSIPAPALHSVASSSALADQGIAEFIQHLANISIVDIRHLLGGLDYQDDEIVQVHRHLTGSTATLTAHSSYTASPAAAQAHHSEAQHAYSGGTIAAQQAQNQHVQHAVHAPASVVAARAGQPADAHSNGHYDATSAVSQTRSSSEHDNGGHAAAVFRSPASAHTAIPIDDIHITPATVMNKRQRTDEGQRSPSEAVKHEASDHYSLTDTAELSAPDSANGTTPSIQQQLPADPSSAAPLSRHGIQVATACAPCYRLKVRCQGGRPCARCLKRGYECVNRLVGDSDAHWRKTHGQLQGGNSAEKTPKSAKPKPPHGVLADGLLAHHAGQYRHIDGLDPNHAYAADVKAYHSLPSSHLQYPPRDTSVLAKYTAYGLSDGIVHNMHYLLVRTVATTEGWSHFVQAMCSSPAIGEALRTADPLMANARRRWYYDHSDSPTMHTATEITTPSAQFPILTISRHGITLMSSVTGSSHYFPLHAHAIPSLRLALADPAADTYILHRTVQVNAAWEEEFGICQAAVKSMFLKYGVSAPLKLFHTSHLSVQELVQLYAWVTVANPSIKGPRGVQRSLPIRMHTSYSPAGLACILTHRQGLSPDGMSYMDTFTLTPYMPHNVYSSGGGSGVQSGGSAVQTARTQSSGKGAECHDYVLADLVCELDF